MIDKINKLLDSKDLDNILVAIQLAYTLPFEDFNGLLVERTTGYASHNHYKFRRNNTYYIMVRGHIVNLGHSNADFFKDSIDITPENYEGENTRENSKIT